MIKIEAMLGSQSRLCPWEPFLFSSQIKIYAVLVSKEEHLAKQQNLDIISGRHYDLDLDGNLDIGQVSHADPAPVLLRLRHLLLLEQVRLKTLLY